MTPSPTSWLPGSSFGSGALSPWAAARVTDRRRIESIAAVRPPRMARRVLIVGPSFETVYDHPGSSQLAPSMKAPRLSTLSDHLLRPVHFCPVHRSRLFALKGACGCPGSVSQSGRRAQTLRGESALYAPL